MKKNMKFILQVLIIIFAGGMCLGKMLNWKLSLMFNCAMRGCLLPQHHSLYVYTCSKKRIFRFTYASFLSVINTSVILQLFFSQSHKRVVVIRFLCCLLPVVSNRTQQSLSSENIFCLGLNKHSAGVAAVAAVFFHPAHFFNLYSLRCSHTTHKRI